MIQSAVTEISAAQTKVYGDGTPAKDALDAAAKKLQDIVDDNREDIEAIKFEGWK